MQFFGNSGQLKSHEVCWALDEASCRAGSGLMWSLDQEFVEGKVLGARPALALLFVWNEHSEPLFLAETIKFYGNMSN